MEDLMKIYNLGSLNLDRVYHVNSFVQPAQTIMATDYKVFCGGKGLNQSLALARAGASVYHIGMAGPDGRMLIDLLKSSGVDIRYLGSSDCDCGHAVIQVEPSGQNCIIVFGGANIKLSEEYIGKAISTIGPDDILLTQNETSGVAYAIKTAHSRGAKIALNPSPVTPGLFNYPLELVDIFILNEIEGARLAGQDGSYEDILRALSKRFPAAELVLTVGKDGAFYKKGKKILHQPALDVKAVDTTAAGDTFCGYFLASLAKRFSSGEALLFATRAAAISVGRNGAAPSIPIWDEVVKYSK